MKKKPIKSAKTHETASTFHLDKKDIISGLEVKKGSSFFLGRYPMSAVMTVLEKKGFLREARKRRLWPLEFDLDSSEFPPLQRLQVFLRDKKPENRVMDLKIQESALKTEDLLLEDTSYSEVKMLYLQWLTLQNPLLKFSSQRPPLPGQAYPGLKLGRKIVDIFKYLARLGQDDGILAHPCYFHNALLFSRAFSFLRPEKRGEVLAIRKSFRDLPFVQLAWIIHLNCLRTADSEVYEWKAEEQVHPMNRLLKKHFESREYKNRVEKTQKSLKFWIDWECYKKKIPTAFK
ncbi:MAG: hypothetical protein JXB23_01635 [Candidatus Aminicenantes bacterium]|nr:hypothetical protein [Candidatus Aminicenantes bacterium]